ncbi:unnamed protein product [Rotaria sordida]|uniref:ZZ-type domain-containing protein n=1 Tax=Rotaria sordida TaxID=392033 RepID=A0A814UUW7_9BILA|nr:unnamed protein product [Rotaria sordida]
MSSTQQQIILDISSNKDIYETLEKKISELNNNYLQDQFTLQYIDEDNDRITFSSNDELQSALKNYSINGLIKIFIKPKSKINEQLNQNTTIHIGIICDGCQGPVIGNRYKCMECIDYDLCQTCSNKNLHSEYNMLKLTRVFQHHRWKELFELIESYIPEYLRTEKLNEILNQFKTSEQADKSINETILLENIGEILSSFGINCDYSVNKQTDEELKSQKKNEESRTTINTSTESKPTVPFLNNLFQQFQTIFAPIFQHLTTTKTVSPEEDQQAQDQKKIDECIERMTSIGFVDSNGVLTELIKSKKGDPEQVLDVINQQNYKNEAFL